MKTKTRMLLLSAALIVSAGIAQAAITVDDVVKSYQGAAFTSIEVTESPALIKVEAIKDGVKLEILYDKASGDVIRREQSAASASDATKSGVEVRSVSDDAGLDKHGSRSNDDQHDQDGTEDDSSDDSGDDSSDHGSDHGAGHDAGDDHGSDHGGDSGSSDDSDDN